MNNVTDLTAYREEQAQLSRIADKIVLADARMKRVERHAAELAEIDKLFDCLDGDGGSAA